jgi:hypothetical protein
MKDDITRVCSAEVKWWTPPPKCRHGEVLHQRSPGQLRLLYSGVHTGSGAHPASRPMGTGVKQTTHLHSVPRLRVMEL